MAQQVILHVQLIGPVKRCLQLFERTDGNHQIPASAIIIAY